MRHEEKACRGSTKSRATKGSENGGDKVADVPLASSYLLFYAFRPNFAATRRIWASNNEQANQRELHFPHPCRHLEEKIGSWR
jgi:hypothetical protein